MNKEERENKEEDEIQKESSGKQFLTIMVLLLLIVMIIGFSFSTLNFTGKKDETNTLSTGNVFLDFTEDTNGINITDAVPVTDLVGKSLMDPNQYFDFTVSTKISGQVKITYEISLEKLKDSTLSDDSVKVYLEKKSSGIYVEEMPPKTFTPIKEKSSVGTPAGNMILVQGTKEETDESQYRLRMWVNKSSELDDVSRTYKVQVAVNAKIDV